jgi:hypothetical protein
MRKFAEHYAATGNISKSLVMAGYSPRATGHGQYLLKRPDIQDAVAYYQAVFADAAAYTPEKLVRQWAMMAAFDITACLNPDGSLKRLDALDPATRDALRLALVGVEFKNGRAKYHFAKVEALIQIGRLLGLYDKETAGAGEGLTLTINVGANVTVQAAAQGHHDDLGPFTMHLPATPLPPQR